MLFRSVLVAHDVVEVREVAEQGSREVGERCAEIGRAFEAIEKTVYMEVVVRDDEADVGAYWTQVEERHGIRGRVGSDGTPRLLNAGGPPAAVADHVRGFQSLGIDQVIWIFRNPFDLETMSRLTEVRAALG